MFDFEKALNEWRSNYRNKKHLASSTIEELESHLRDSFEHLLEEHPPEEAFGLAVEQLGHSKELSSEFRKINDLSFTDKLVLRGHHLFLFVLVALIFVYGFPLGSRIGGTLLGVHVGFILVGYGTALFLGLIGCYGMIRSRSEAVSFYHSYRNYSRRFNLLIFTGTLIGFILGMLWCHQSWGVYFGWDPKEIGALAVTFLALGIFAIQWKRTLAMHHLAQMNLALSIVTMLAWFGASGSLTVSGLMMHSLFYGWITIQLIAFFLPLFVPVKRMTT